MKIPKHVAIIMDGNGRWATDQGQERLFGHRAGTESVRQAVEAAAEAGVGYLSLFAFSSENWGRPQTEVDGLMELLIKAVYVETPKLIKNNVRLLAIGDLGHLPLHVQEQFADSMAQTAACTGLRLVLALSYSGTWDILQAVNACIAAIAAGKRAALPIDATLLETYLSTRNIPAPDLLIRTSGEKRISNFMLWQLAYTELYFTEVLWPDFRKQDFQDALNDYAGRERRFGKTGEQHKNNG